MLTAQYDVYDFYVQASDTSMPQLSICPYDLLRDKA